MLTAVDPETGELTGQLMLGITVPRVEVQRRGQRLMSPQEFNAQRTWELEEGDKLTVKGVDVAGTVMYEVKVVRHWEADDA